MFGGPPFLPANEPQTQRGDGSPEGVVEPPPRNLQPRDSDREGDPDPSGRRASSEPDPRRVPEGKLERHARAVRRVGFPSVEERERGAPRAKRGGELEGRRHSGALERPRPENAIRRDPDIGVIVQTPERAPAQRPTSPALLPVGGEVEALKL